MRPIQIVLDYNENSLKLSFGSDKEVNDAFSRIANPGPPSPDYDPLQVNAYQYVIRSLMRSGEKITAIKFYRQMTRLGLHESKLACEEIESRQF
jgi:ribosomal protein L7/L12